MRYALVILLLSLGACQSATMQQAAKGVAIGVCSGLTAGACGVAAFGVSLAMTEERERLRALQAAQDDEMRRHVLRQIRDLRNTPEQELRLAAGAAG